MKPKRKHALLGLAGAVLALQPASATQYTYYSPALTSSPLTLGPGETAFGVSIPLFDKDAPAHAATPVLKSVTVSLEVTFAGDLGFYNSSSEEVAVTYNLSGARVTATVVGDPTNVLAPLTTTPPLLLSGSQTVGADASVAIAAQSSGAPSATSTEAAVLTRYSAGSDAIAYDVDFTALYPQYVSTTPTGFLCLVANDRATARLKVVYDADPTDPTAVELLSFDCTWASPGPAVLAWRTGVEIATVGFHVERSAGAAWERITPQLIPATGGGQPASYRFEDAGWTLAMAAKYRLIEVTTNAQEEILGETSVRVAATATANLTPTGLDLSVHGQPAATAFLDSAPEIRGPWQELGSVQIDAAGSGRILIPGPPTEPQRFYRWRLAE